MIITNQHSLVIDTVRLDVVDGIELVDPFSAVGRKYQLSAIRIRYAWDWENSRWDAAKVYLAGTVLRKDGTHSKVEYEGYPPHRFDQLDEWQWLVPVLNFARPGYRPGRLNMEVEL